MEDQELLAIIDRYLDGALSEGERTDLERQIAEDPDFRAEVQLQRELREAYQDPGRLRLRSVMAEIMQEPLTPEEEPSAPTTTQSSRWWRWVLLLALLGLLIGSIWFGRRGNSTSKTIPQETIIEEIGDDDEKPEEFLEESEQGQEQPPKKETPPTTTNRAIAQLDPSDFIPNKVMDDIIKDGFRSGEDLNIEITTPAIDGVFKLSNTKNIAIPFTGIVKGLEADGNTSLVLLLFNNKDNNKPIEEIPFEVQRKTTDPLFELSPTLSVRGGLYYFLIETEAGDVLAAGRFKIEN